MQLTIADFQGNLEWKWDRLSFELPPCIKERIRAIPFQECGSSEDTLMWKCTKDEAFSTNSSYQLVISDGGIENTFKGA